MISLRELTESLRLKYRKQYPAEDYILIESLLEEFQDWFYSNCLRNCIPSIKALFSHRIRNYYKVIDDYVCNIAEYELERWPPYVLRQNWFDVRKAVDSGYWSVETVNAKIKEMMK